MTLASFRRDWITKPIFGMAQHALPHLSDTEREAIEAGDVWWDADLFTGNPDWTEAARLRRPPSSPRRSRQFLDGPVEELCACSTIGRSIGSRHDLPPEAWDFLKAQNSSR